MWENFACGIQNTGNFCLWNPESWALDYGILSRNLESCWRLECGIQVPLIKNPEYSTWNPESMVWNPGSKTVLNSLTWCDSFVKIPHPELLLSLSWIQFSFLIPHPMPTFWQIPLHEQQSNDVSGLQNFVFLRIPLCILGKSWIPKIPFKTLLI